MKVPQKLFGLICILLVLADSVGSMMLWLQWKIDGVKAQVESHIISTVSEDKLVLLKFSKEESEMLVRWEHPREFEYKRQMYDVVRKKTVGDTIYFWCWWDREETQLKREMERIASRFLGAFPEQKVEERPKLSRHCECFPATDPYKFCISQDFVSWEYGMRLNYLSFSPQPPTPPPRLVV